MGFLGIGDGKFDLKLNGTEFSPGSKIEGTATLTLNQDVKGKGVVAEIWGERVETSRAMNGQIQRRTVVVYKFAANLDGERTYLKTESPKAYKISLDAPLGIVGTAQPQGTAGKIFAALGEMGGGQGPIMWFVGVKMLMPLLEFGISKKQQINIVGGMQGSPTVMQ